MADSAPGLRAGKLPQGLLERLLSTIDRSDQRVRLWPGIGEDAAVIDFGETSLIATSDPVTFATDLVGWYAVQVNANDIAACGGDPRWFMATVFLPEGSSPDVAERIFEQIRDAAEAIDVSLVGGHTEVTLDLPRPIVCGAMLGEAARDAPVATSGAQLGDAIVLTKGVAIEGTALLAREMSSRLGATGMSRSALERAANYLFDPGISVLPEARVARSSTGVHAMHDPTEGGLATGLAELAAASEVGLLINAAGVNVLPEPADICRRLGADPWGLIASGALLIAVAPEYADELVASLGDASIDAAVIGHATRQAEGLRVVDGDETRALPLFERDEVARILGE